MKKTDGKWDKDDRCKYFFAGGGNDQKPTVPEYPTLFAVNEFAAVGRPLGRKGRPWEKFMESLDAGVDTFLDSGIFFLTNQHKRAHDVSMDDALALAPEEIDNFNWLFDVYCEICSEFGDRLWGYNELDQGGRENKRRVRATLEAEGLNPIPVYHPLNDGWDYFDELAQGYDRMCFGNLVQADAHTRRRLFATAYERHADYPDLFIHFLGITPNEMQMGLPWDSADSSSWLAMWNWPSSMKVGAAGRRGWKIPEKWHTPFSAPFEVREHVARFAMTEMTLMTRGMKHYHDTRSDYFGTPTYMKGQEQ
jgi:hypothetical protein